MLLEYPTLILTVHHMRLEKRLKAVTVSMTSSLKPLDWKLRQLKKLVRPECVRQRNEVAIKLGIIAKLSQGPV